MLTARRRAALALTAAFAIFFAPQLFTTRVPYYRDTLVTIIPFRAVIHERLRALELPQWYPREGIGVPFIGQVSTATFHPQSLLFLWLPPVQAVKWNLLLMYAVGLAGAYRFARALGHGRAASIAAACAFGFGGYSLGVSHNLVYAGPHAMLPWVAFFALRARQTGAWRHAVAAGVALALVFLQGDAQGYLHGGLLVVAAALTARRLELRRTALLCGAAAALSLFLMAPELLPALTVASESLRGVGERSATPGFTWAFHPFRVFELFVGGFVPDVVRNEFTKVFFSGGRALWATTLFFGAGALCLAAAAVPAVRRPGWPFVAVAVFALWMSLGDRGVLMALLVKAVPLVGKFRFPEKYLSLFWVASVPFVAAGAAALGSARRLPVVLGALAAAAAVAAFALATPEAVAWLRQPVPASASFDGAVADAWRAGLLRSALAVALLALIVWRAAPERRPALAALVIFLELYLVNSPHLPTIPAEVLTAANPIAAAVQRGSRTFRAVSLSAPSTVSLGDGEPWAIGSRRALRANTAELDGVATLETNSPAVSWRYALLQGTRGVPLRPELFHGCYRLTTDAPNAVFRDPETSLALQRLPCHERAFVAPAVPANSAAEAAALLNQSPQTLLVVEGGERTVAGGTARITVDEPERVEIEVAADGRAALYLADGFASGWSATVDGAAARILPANVAARAVYLDAGSHHVVFTYRSAHLLPGLLLGALGWLLVGAVATATLTARLRRPGRSRTP